eukprot:4122856-Ditylum_brightwellii.AAC.1
MDEESGQGRQQESCQGFSDPVPIWAKTPKRLLDNFELMRYYETVGCRVTVSNTVYKTTIKSFTDQWAGLKGWKQQKQPVVPKITRKLPVMQWRDVFDEFLHRKVGVRTTPLSYITRAIALALRSASDNKDDLPHREEFDSVEEELVAQASHMYPPYQEDNAAVYYCLEEAVRGTQYASSLKPCQQVKNGRGALVWNGQMLYPLERFIGQHRGAFIAMKEAVEHAVMANIKSDADPTSETNQRHHFQLAATYLQPFCSVLKKFPSGAKCDAIKISDVTASGFGTKPIAGKTGISLRYHTSEEYEELTQSQKDELQEWKEKSNPTQSRKANGRGQEQGEKRKSPCSKQENYKQDRMIAASVYMNMKAISKKKRDVGEVNLPKALIMSLFEDKDVKKAIRASVPAAEVIEVVSPAKDK